MSLYLTKMALYIFLSLLTSIAMAGEDDVLKREIADRIELQRRMIRKVEMSGVMESGKASADEAKRWQLSPIPESRITFTYATELASGTTYLKTDVFVNGKPYCYEASGAAGRWVLVTPIAPGGTAVSATVSNTPPEQVDATQIIIGYVKLNNVELDDAIRSAHDIRIREEKGEDGERVYHIILLQKYRNEISSHGETVIGDSYNLYELWLLPEKGMLPVRIDQLNCRLQNAHPTIATTYHENNIFSVLRQSDIREVSPGIYFPHRMIAYSAVRPDSDSSKQIVLDKVAVNDTAVVRAVQIPMGAWVTDTVKKTKFRAGGSPEMFDHQIAREISAVQSARDTLPAPGAQAGSGPAAAEPTSSQSRWLYIAVAGVIAIVSILAVRYWRTRTARPRP